MASIPTPVVEIGFDLTAAGTGPFLRLDDPISGKLDSTEWTLGGTLFYDVTSKVRSIATRRGKNRQLDNYDPGLCNIVFNNNDRTFDPEFAASPYYGQIIPKRAIRISSGGVRTFTGVIDDWSLSYSPDGDSIASAAASDALVYFANQTLSTRTSTVQKSGTRIAEILADPSVNWPAGSTDIEVGETTLGADVIPEDQNVLSYLRTVTKSEPGSLFIGKSGDVTYRDRRTAPSSGGLVFSDEGTDIPYQNLAISYGSEYLHNEISITSTGGTATASDADSIDEYGISNFTQSDLLIDTLADTSALASYYANKFSQPEYRFESIDVTLLPMSPTDQASVLALEIGTVVEIRFTPNGIAPAISKFAEIIRIDHDIDPENHFVSFGFSTLEYALLVLDDTTFGKLDSGNALAF